MSIVININSRGTLTLPKSLRKKYALGDQIILDETDEGLVLRPAVTFPIEIYSDARAAEFHKQNEQELKRFKLK